jgi:hypothetical protein
MKSLDEDMKALLIVKVDENYDFDSNSDAKSDYE